MENNSNLHKFSSLKTLFLSFLFLFIGLCTFAFLLFNGIKLLNDSNPYQTVLHINMFFRSYNFREIDENPFPYLLAIVLVSSIIGSLWLTFIASNYEQRIKYQIFTIPWISVILTSPIWGVIWSVNLRNPQYFMEHYPSNSEAVMWLFYQTDAMSGLKLGWLSAIQSFPINILSYVVFCIMLGIGKKLF